MSDALPVITGAATKTNFVMKGYLMQALDNLVAQQTLTKIPPPPDHPRMRIFRDTKYALPPVPPSNLNP